MGSLWGGVVRGMFRSAPVGTPGSIKLWVSEGLGVQGVGWWEHQAVGE